MGDGDAAGESTRGLFVGVDRDEFVWRLGWVLLAIAGEPGVSLIDPKLMFFNLDAGVGGAPLGISPEAPAALMVTEGLRL